MTPAYLVENLSFSHGDRCVLKIDRMEVGPGELVALVGPNGSGKTTLLHVLAFLAEPQEGRISLFGQTSTGRNLMPFRRRVGLLLQQSYLFHTSVLANILWGMRIRGVSRSVARSKALAALELVGLAGFENRYSSALSGGEAQRVALARALVLDPDVLLLDEPSSHLDRESVQRMDEIVHDLNRTHGKTVIMTTHSQEQVKSFAGRVLHIFGGRLSSASLDNLFKGNLREQGSIFDTGKIIVRLSAPVKSAAYLTIEPSEIILSVGNGGKDVPNTFPGRIVAMAEDNGHIAVEVQAGERFRVALDRSVAHSLNLRLGQGVSVVLGDESVKVF